jgi:phage terminase large subunit GpA-like protein
MTAAEALERDFQSVVPMKARERMRVDVAGMFRDLIRDSVNRLTVSQWAEQKRILPRDLTSLPGPFSWATTPYLKEIADCFSESSPVQKIAVMKGSRVGVTVSVGESWLGYIIDCAPGPTMFISADKESAQTQIELRLDRMLASAGLQGKIFSQVEKSHSKKTGDTKSKKEFPGGFLLALGPNVAAKLRSFGVRYIFFDEVDGYQQEIGQEGDPIMLAERRSDEFERLRKILYVSTPLVEQTSRIKPLFEAGDQRYYFVPCKECGHMQRLRWRDDDGEFRLKFETDDKGRLIFDLDAEGKPIPGSAHVWYECEKCNGHWSNEDKAYFLPRGEWRPTAEPEEPNFRSYHISSLYSPVGMRSWEAIVREFQKAKDSPPKLRVFVNTALGETWVERGEAPSWERILVRRGGYRAGTLSPEAEALFLTAAVDVQADRLEAEIVAWGRDKESWSVEYVVFHAKGGTTEYIDDPCWQELERALTAPHAGMKVEICLIDEKFQPHTVRQFCDRFDNVYPSMGDNRVGLKGQTIALRPIEEFPKLKRVNIFTHGLKNELYSYLRQGPPELGEPYPAGYCHFPSDYSERYFKQLTSEEFVKERTRTGTIKMTWRVIHGRRNEAHDARIYNMAALLVFQGVVADEAFGEPITQQQFWDWAAQRRQVKGFITEVEEEKQG